MYLHLGSRKILENIHEPFSLVLAFYSSTVLSGLNLIWSLYEDGKSLHILGARFIMKKEHKNINRKVALLKTQG